MVLANYPRTGHPLLIILTKAQEIYTLITKLLFRTFALEATVLVKPTHTVNNIIVPMMATSPKSMAVLLHSNLESVLISILKKSESGRGFVR